LTGKEKAQGTEHGAKSIERRAKSRENGAPKVDVKV